MKTEDQLRKEYGKAKATVRQCELALERAQDALADAQRAEDCAYFALEDFRAKRETGE